MPIVDIATFPHPETKAEIELGTWVRGTVAKERVYQTTLLPIQKERKGRRRVQQQREYDYPTPEKTPARLQQQAKFKDGMEAWALLSPEEKAAWAETAKAEMKRTRSRPLLYRAVNGLNMFMRDFLTSGSGE